MSENAHRRAQELECLVCMCARWAAASSRCPRARSSRLIRLQVRGGQQSHNRRPCIGSRARAGCRTHHLAMRRVFPIAHLPRCSCSPPASWTTPSIRSCASASSCPTRYTTYTSPSPCPARASVASAVDLCNTLPD